MHCVDWFGDGTVVVVDLALACCGVESGMAVPADARTVDAPGPRSRLVAVVSGTVSRPLAPAVDRALDELSGSGRPLTVIAFGACACGGGPYWDSRSVVNGMDALPHGSTVPGRADGRPRRGADLWIPGCPPPPQALARALDGLRRQWAAPSTAVGR